MWYNCNENQLIRVMWHPASECAFFCPGRARQHFRRIGSPPSQAIDQGTTLHLDITGSLAQNFLTPSTAQPGTAGKSSQQEKKKEKRVQFVRIAQFITSIVSQQISGERGSKGATCGKYHCTGLLLLQMQPQDRTRQARQGKKDKATTTAGGKDRLAQGSTRVDLANNLPCPPGSYQDNKVDYCTKVGLHVLSSSFSRPCTALPINPEN